MRKTEHKYNGVLHKYEVAFKLNSSDRGFIPGIPVFMVNNLTAAGPSQDPFGGVSPTKMNNASEMLQCHLKTINQGTEQFIGFRVNDISDEDKISFQEHLNQSEQTVVLSHQPILFNNDLTTPKTKKNTFNSVIKSSTVKFAPENICYFHINIRTLSGGEIRAIWDSGSMRSVCLSSILKDETHFYNQHTDETSIEVVGGGRTTRQIHQTLLPLKHSTHRYLLTNVLSVPKIVEDLREYDMTEELQAAYFDYRHHCDNKGITPIRVMAWFH